MVSKTEDWIQNFTPIAKAMAYRYSKYTGFRIDMDDLFQVGMMSIFLHQDAYLTHAYRKAILTQKMKSAILDEIRSADVLSRAQRMQSKHLREAIIQLEHQLGNRPSHTELSQATDIPVSQIHQIAIRNNYAHPVSFDATFSVEDEEQIASSYNIYQNPMIDIMNQQIISMIHHYLSHHITREKEILTLYFFEEKKLKEIAKLFHLTESRVGQLLQQALQDLRVHLQVTD